MYKLLNPLLEFRSLWIPLIGILLVGIFSNFLVAGLALAIYLLSSGSTYKNQFLLLLFLSTCFLASNLTASFSFAQDFRFIVLGFALVYLLYNRNIPKNPGNYILPFTVLATAITLLFSPVGFDAVLRSIAFWFIAIVIFESYNRSYEKQPKITSRLLVGLILIFSGINLLLIYLGGSEMYFAGRFRGLMGNPNQLGLVAMFSYGIVHLLKKRNETGLSGNFYKATKIILVILVLVSGSRTAILGLMSYEFIHRLYNNKLALLLSFLAMAVLYYLSLSVDLVALTQSLGLSDELRVETLETGSGRTEVWEVAWEEIKTAPVLGKGMMYDDYFILEYGEEHYGYGRARQWYGIWNSYLSLLLDVGIIGLLAYFFFVFKIYSLAHQKNLAVAFLIMSLISGMAESWMATSMSALSPLFLLYWAIQSHPPEEEKQEAITEG